MASENNPPAFPRPGFEQPAGMQDGMTLRDYFAGQAMFVCFADSYDNDWGRRGKDHAKAAARRAYAWADAMLAEREDN
jgi:hypothetical protein